MNTDDGVMDESEAAWWGVEHWCHGIERKYPVLHWADEPETGAGPRVAFECDHCGQRYAFHEARAGDDTQRQPSSAD